MHFKSGRHAGIGLLAPKETTLKVIVQNKTNSLLLLLLLFTSGIFGSHLSSFMRQTVKGNQTGSCPTDFGFPKALDLELFGNCHPPVCVC
jgi:hypothetical protein